MNKEWFIDVSERTGWTFVQASIAAVGSEALAVATIQGDVSVLRASLVGGVAAVLSLAKGIAAKRIGDPNTAATRRKTQS